MCKPHHLTTHPVILNSLSSRNGVALRLGADYHTLRLVEPRDRAVRDLQVLLHKRRRREREPLGETNVLEAVGVEDFEEAQCRVPRVLDIVTCVCRAGQSG